VDAWQQPGLYHLDMQAGAPPDAFAVKGQNWGFPTYNWERMTQDGFSWWKQRFSQMSEYFDAFRIDHILGFFRIWSIPMESVKGSWATSFRRCRWTRWNSPNAAFRPILSATSSPTLPMISSKKSSAPTWSPMQGSSSTRTRGGNGDAGGITRLAFFPHR